MLLRSILGIGVDIYYHLEKEQPFSGCSSLMEVELFCWRCSNPYLPPLEVLLGIWSRRRTKFGFYPLGALGIRSEALQGLG